MNNSFYSPPLLTLDLFSKSVQAVCVLVFISTSFSCRKINDGINDVRQFKDVSSLSQSETQNSNQNPSKVSLLESLELVETPNERLPFTLLFKPAKNVLESIRDNNFKDLITYYHVLTTQEPENVYAKFSLSSAYLLSGDYASALNLLEDLAKAAPDFLPLYVNRITANRALGKKDSVSSDFDVISKAIRDHNVKFDAVSSKIIDGLKHISFGKTSYRSAFLGKDPPLPSTVMQIDKYYTGQTILLAHGTNHVKRACDTIDSIAPETKDFSRRHTLRGACLSELGFYNKAIASFEAAIKLQPHSSEAYYQYGKYALKQKQFKTGISNLMSARRLSPDRVDILVDLAEAHYQNEDFQITLSLLNEEALSKLREEDSVYYLSQVGDYDVTFLLARLLSIKGDAYRELGQDRSAQEEYSKAINIARAESTYLLDYRYLEYQAYIKRAKSFYYVGDFTASVSELTRLIDLKPFSNLYESWNETGNLYLWRGKAFYKSGEFQAAKKDFESALKLDSKLFEARYYLELI